MQAKATVFICIFTAPSKDTIKTLYLQVDPFSPAMTSFEKLDEYNTLLTAEREAIKSVRDIERDTEEILQQRLREEQNVVLITPYIDIACVKQDDLFQEGEDAIKVLSLPEKQNFLFNYIIWEFLEFPRWG